MSALSTRAARLIDVHAHYGIPDDPRFASRAGSKAHYAGPSVVWSAQDNLSFMDEAGIDVQLLSHPSDLPVELCRRYNDYGAELVDSYPDRFGLLAAIPGTDPSQAVVEIRRAAEELKADGYVMVTNYGGTYFGDSGLQPVWELLNDLAATVFVHPVQPTGYEHIGCGRPGPVIEFPMDSARTMVDALYSGVLRRYPAIRFVIAHGGGVLPTLANRIATIGVQSWVPNPEQITAEEIRGEVAGLYYDTALASSAHSLLPVLATTTADHLVFGTDYPPASPEVIRANMDELATTSALDDRQVRALSGNALELFPRLRARLSTLSEH